MLLTDIKYYSRLPFVNLGKRAKSIFSIRLITLIISIIFGSILLGGKSSNFPLVTLHSDHSDVARGLYDALKDTFSGEKNFMTTSELKILAEYIENHIEDTPQIILSGLFGWCYASYNTPELNYSEGSDFGNPISGDQHHHNTTIHCLEYGSDSIFDYRGELSEIGLNIILAYAYTADFETSGSTLTDTVYVPDDTYKSELASRKQEVHRFIVVLIMSICVQSIMFIGTFFYYGMRGNARDDKKISVSLKHIFGVFSLLNCILTNIGFIIIIVQIKNLQSSVNNELSSYGIYMKLGARFITVIVFWFCFSLIIFGLWAGPVWFNRSIKEQNIQTDQIPLAMDAYDYDYNYDNEYDDENENDDDNENENENESDDEDYKNENNSRREAHTTNYNHSVRSSNSTDSLDNNDKAEVTVSSRITSSSSTQDDDPFSNSYEETKDTSSTTIHQPFHSTAFIRSEELFLKRKPPLMNNSTLDNEDLVPMSPIINLPTGKIARGVSVTPNVVLTNSDESW